MNIDRQEHWVAKAQREACNLLEHEEPEPAPRVRLLKNLDLSKADPNCERCGGDGIVSHKKIPDGSRMIKVPIVCRCVSRNGGVMPDMLDKIIAEADEALESGTFASSVATDIMNLPPEHQEKATAQIIKVANDPESDERTKKAMQEVLDILQGKRNKS